MAVAVLATGIVGMASPPVSAAGPAEWSPLSFSFPGTNPCDDANHTLNFEGQILNHVFIDGAGGTHVHSTLLGAFWSSDGFSGRTARGITDSVLPSGTEVFTVGLTNHMMNDAHQVINVSGSVQMKVVNGDTIVEDFVVEQRCVGKPA